MALHTTCRHTVLFYRDPESVRDNVAAYIADALRDGRPALVIARPLLRQQLAIELHRKHVQGEPFGAGRGEFITLDAEATLDQLLVDGKPDRELFRRVIGRPLQELCRRGRRVAAYGEMVGLLCERGRYADAVTVEGMWNDLLAEVDSDLYCGYSAHLFRTEEAADFLEQIRRAHDRVDEDAPERLVDA